MRTLTIDDIPVPVADWLQSQGCDPVLITRDGEPVAMVAPVDDLDLEALCLSKNPVFWEIIERSRERSRTEGTLTLEEVRRELGLPPCSD